MLIDEKISSRDFLKAFEFCRDTIGEKPVENISVNQVSADTRKQVTELIERCKAKRGENYARQNNDA